MKQHPFHLMPDMLVGPFRIQARLGAGGFGAVFRVECEGELYALKFAVHGPDSEDLNRTDERARRELACLLLITHPHVVRVWAHGRWPHPRTGYHYVVMDYVEGLTLPEWVRQQRPPLGQVLRLFGTLALTLDTLHAQDIHHRDLKGANILVRQRDGEPVLVDFGAGELSTVASPLTEGPLPPGTPHLRTPEALRFHREQYADPSARYPFRPTDDLYALGATLYEVLTGAPAFPPTLPRELLTVLIEKEMPPSPAVLNPQVPPALAQLVLQLLAKRPEQRPASGRQLHERLQALLREGSPLLEQPLWPGAHAATTEGVGPPPVTSSTPGPADWGEARTSPGSTSLGEGSVPAEPAQRGAPGPARRSRWQGVAGMAGLALLTAAGAALWLTSPFTSEPPGGLAPAASTLGEPPLPPEPEPSPAELPAQAGVAPHETGGDGGTPPLASALPDGGALAQATPPPPSPNEKEKGPPMRKKPSAKPPTAPSPSVPPLAAVVAACVAAGSCASPEPAVRPGPPPRQLCPPGAWKVMSERFHIGTRYLAGFRGYVVLPGSYDSWPPLHEVTTTITEGRHEAVGVMVDYDYGVKGKQIGLPHESILVGDFFIRDRLYARFTEVRLPDGERLPFCAELVDKEKKDVGVPLLPGSKPGAALVPALVEVVSSPGEH